MNRPGAADEGPRVRASLERVDATTAPTGSSPRRSAPALEDAALVGLVREGDGRALEDLYVRYGRPCFSLARRILGDQQLAEDVVQEVFLSLWKDASRYDPSRGGFATWLLSMTHHKAVDVVRREENQRKRRAAADAQDATAEPLPAPDEEAWTTLRRERVLASLAVLPPAQRNALRLAYFGGYTQREIAGLTDTPLGTVKTRMLAGMRKMRDSLDGAVNDDGIDASGGSPGSGRGGDR